MVDRDGRAGIVAVEHDLNGVTDRRHLGVVERALLEDGGIAGGQQQPVALAQRHFQLLGEVQHQLWARP